MLSSVKAEVDRENVNAAVLMNSDMINHPLSPQLESQRVLHNQKVHIIDRLFLSDIAHVYFSQNYKFCSTFLYDCVC